MYNRLKTFLGKHNMLYHHQHGVREKCSTQHALIGIVNRIQLNNDKKLFCCGIFMDRKKAFDTVNHSILMQKLEHYGICGVENIWFSSHLNDRLPTTQVGAHVFPHCRIPTLPYSHIAVFPQGTYLGPLLFLICINYIYISSQKISFFLFSDETNLLYGDKSLRSLRN